MDTPREECACSCDTTNEYYHGIDTEYACDSSFILGDAATSSGANDPSFWSMHGTLERYFQFALAKGWMESLAWKSSARVYSGSLVRIGGGSGVTASSASQSSNVFDGLLRGRAAIW